jgi:hypothetical protein
MSCFGLPEYWLDNHHRIMSKSLSDLHVEISEGTYEPNQVTLLAQRQALLPFTHQMRSKRENKSHREADHQDQKAS